MSDIQRDRRLAPGNRNGILKQEVSLFASPLRMLTDLSQGLRPEVYFKPQEVWEIRGAEYVIHPVPSI